MTQKITIVIFRKREHTADECVIELLRLRNQKCYRTSVHECYRTNKNKLTNTATNDAIESKGESPTDVEPVLTIIVAGKGAFTGGATTGEGAITGVANGAVASVGGATGKGVVTGAVAFNGGVTRVACAMHCGGIDPKIRSI